MAGSKPLGEDYDDKRVDDEKIQKYVLRMAPHVVWGDPEARVLDGGVTAGAVTPSPGNAPPGAAGAASGGKAAGRPVAKTIPVPPGVPQGVSYLAVGDSALRL